MDKGNEARAETAATPKDEQTLRHEGQKDRNFVTALARGFELLRAFRPGDEYLGNGELSARTGIPRPTVSRLTHTLTRLGYLRYSEYLEKYQLGVGVLALGYRYLSSVGVRDVARPFMQSLADRTDCLVALGTADRGEMTYIEVCQGAGPLVLRLEVGSRIPLLNSAMGRAFLVGLREDRRQQYMEDLAALTGRDIAEIRAEVGAAQRYYREHGFCISQGEWDDEISGVAVPLVLESGAQVMAFNCGGASLRLDASTLENGLGPALARMTQRVQAVLSGEESRRQ